MSRKKKVDPVMVGRILTYGSRSGNLRYWANSPEARRSGATYNAIKERTRDLGWNIYRAITTPIQNEHPQRWTQLEEKYVQDNPSKTARELSTKLNRSISSIQSKRRRLNNDTGK